MQHLGAARVRAGVGKVQVAKLDIALQYNDSYSESVFSFANNINTVDGGTHLSGFRTALTRTINTAGQQMGLFKDVKENLTGDDVREGLTAVISVKIPQPQFEGQTKGKLNSDIGGFVVQFINEKLGEFFDKNPAVMRKIVSKAIDASRAMNNSELWSWSFGDGHYRIAAFGAAGADADESNAAQLWSTVYLAVRPRREAAFHHPAGAGIRNLHQPLDHREPKPAVRATRLSLQPMKRLRTRSLVP